MSAFYDNYLYLCTTNGEAKSTAVQAVGKSTGVLTKWKNGATPQPSTLKKIAEHFGVTIEWLTEDHSDDLPLYPHHHNSKLYS